MGAEGKKIIPKIFYAKNFCAKIVVKMSSLYDVRVKIVGTKDVSLVDVIGYPSYTIWFPYCNFRCPWCQNWPVVEGRNIKILRIRELMNMIKESASIIEYVHVTGGEPTLQPNALRALFKVIHEDLNLKNSLNTNGFSWLVVKNLVNDDLIDHIAMDIKAPLSDPKLYSLVTGVPQGINIVENVEKTLKLVLDRLEFVELRTTFVPPLNVRDLVKIALELKEMGCNKHCYYIIQQFIPNENAPDPRYRSGRIVPINELLEIAKIVKRESGLGNIYIRSMEEGVTTV